MHPATSPPGSGHMGIPWRRVAVAAVALLGLATAVTAIQAYGPDRSAASTRALTVATWNMCGVRQWGCAATGSWAEKRTQLGQLATRAGARVIFLQETCGAELESVRRGLGGSWHTAFRAYSERDAAGRTAPVRCATPGAGTAGFAILSAYPLSAVTTVASQQPAVGVRRGILCATVAAHELRLCTAHLSPRHSDAAHPAWEFRDDQLKALAHAADTRRTVYGGDLNVNPPGSRNPFSWVWPSGPYTDQRECDQTSVSSRAGRDTHVSGHKFDYLFTGLPRVRCSVRDTGKSDHYALLLRVRTG
ncbi:endonuclease/exonuclease/phosphatase family protein [Streptomyces sp. NBC_00696]|uniref:endonuclease/exonuclease/phosphatase family protein n=1 Tax=Streptomyces sp. NBC_00696 TaxID=2903672 RepID=UPI002E328137|nr:endonuclease/exonuclease/phosphatase family protein [Streptomyces sp. NBC_00696]